MAKIPLKDYAEKIGKSRTSCYNKYKRGGFQSAVKLGRDIWIDEDEPFLDDRITSGKYIGFRKKLRTKRIPSQGGDPARKKIK